MPDIICLGEALIDMVSDEPGLGLVQSTQFGKAAGGAPTNVAAGVAILGGSSGLIAKVGQDHFGEFLRQTLWDCEVDLEHFTITPDYETQLAFVARDQQGVPEFCFHVKRSADQMLTPEEISPEYFEEADIFHFGSITLINEPARSATLRAIGIAGDTGKLVSYDPNLRPPLWPDLDMARERIIEGIKLCDIIKMSEEEMRFVTGLEDPQRAMGVIYDMGPELVAVTRGAQGCYYLTDRCFGESPGFEVIPEDATGCGDAFVAAMLVWLLESPHDVADLEDEGLEELFRFANAAGALTATGKGAIPSLPMREEVIELLEREETATEE